MSSSTEFPVIGIGASAGGIDAFRSFFSHMPPDCGMAFVMILHLPAAHKSMLTEILTRWTSMPVIEAENGVRIEPNHVYVPPPHSVVTLNAGHIRVESRSPQSDRVFRPIDGFFDSLGSVLRERSVGIVLSGTGSDGALGLKAIKECGGLTIAQGKNGTAPQYGEMPAGAIATGVVDIIAPVEDIPAQLMRLNNAPLVVAESFETLPSAEDLRLEICSILRAQLGHDFSGYRSQTFLRRVERRMHVVDAKTLPAYIEKLKRSPEEVTLLFRDLLIRVTSFFRDKETFEALAALVIPRLFDGKMADATVRLWVPGCATGEEAYSLAIVLREHMDSLSAAPKVQLFATDIDESAITTARLGRYPKTLLEGLDDRRRRRFFTVSQGGYCVGKEIRDLCTFSMHNLIRDPPFSMMNLVSCRNLLIYMNPDLQGRVIPVFHYSLVPGGILLLGGSESLAQHTNLFETLDKKARIFLRREGRSPELNLHWQRSQLALRGHLAQGHTEMHQNPTSGNQDSTLSHQHGKHAPAADGFKHLLGAEPVDAELGAQLRDALRNSCEQLQSLTEEHQTSLEELRSANEELHSVNEEMQSTNEELETSKEEMQSLNEELHTVNIRLTEKVDELDHTNSDLRNLFDSTQIATAFLDRHLIIRSFTPAIGTIYNLIPSDQGRPLTDIMSHLQYTGLREDVNYVLQMLEPLERRIDRDDRSMHYIMRILPYREPDSTVSGVLVTFIDVTNIVKAEKALVEADVRKDVFLATLSHELRNPLAPIRIAAQLLQSPMLSDEEVKHALGIISRQVGHMSSLLDDLLDVSRITRATFLLKKEYVDLRLLIDDAVEEIQGALDAKRHTLRVEPPESTIIVEVDPVRITQVITNLLTNAVKYTPNGGLIYLGVHIEAQFLTIKVRDSGVGLTGEAMHRVFDMFTRIDSELARTEGGLGIGLALAKGLVQLHGGRLDVNSAGPGQGSEFLICLPRSLIVETASQPADPAQVEHRRLAQPRRILIADDNRDSAESLGMLLKLSGHDVHLAHSGTEAFEAAKRLHPDIGVFDIGMPDFDGYELAERIRHEAWGKQITMIAVTGWGQESDKKRAHLAGFDHHMTKPVDPDQLEQLFEVAIK
ncbi:MAG TPA: chemotaxis protein CheB [Steroidobacteraceae bacterium]|jgi:two-component system CheB/CheR fusion protein|nr:chemotaxis protein CheB [Steroidobacteraceae bacterium]